MKYLIANLKQNKVLSEIQIYEADLRKKGVFNLNIIICPSTPFLSVFQGNNYKLGTQDVSIYPQGAYTGETSAKQLASMGVKYAIIGHSERRKYFMENNSILSQKIANSFAHGIQVVYCIGETKEEYENKKTYSILEQQIALVLNEFTREELKNIIIAYEPVWAIGTGLTPNTQEIEETTKFIKKIILDYYELDLAVLYGGSVDENNIIDFVKIASLDGFLVGGASLKTEKLFSMIDTFDKC